MSESFSTPFAFSSFAEKLCADAGIVTLMDDLGDALRDNPDMIFMGGGNPALIPAAENVFAEALLKIASQDDLRRDLVGYYQSPQGHSDVLAQLAALLSDEFGWNLTAEHIAISNGSQAAFFVLFNLFAGAFPDGTTKKIQLPMAPEYLGYADQGMNHDFFKAAKPTIELLPDGLFKYHVDFSALSIDSDVGAVCVSRPTNPTGNVISDDELMQLDALARAHQVPLIVDGAYGTPFPHIMFEQATPQWNDNIIMVLSLSKLGLPGARTGIVIANPDIIRAFVKANTIVNLAPCNLGPAILRQLLDNKQILALSREHILPFYKERMMTTVGRLQKALDGLPCRIHKPEGAIFLWLWCKDLPITSEDLYQRLKARGVLVVAGHHFFIGIDDEWPHKHECIRITYCQSPDVVAEGIRIIADELRALYASAPHKE